MSTKMTEYIVFLSGKVNTGKTSLSVNVASLLARKGYLVALIDMDFHNHYLYNYFSGEKIERKVSLNDYILVSDNPKVFLRDENRRRPILCIRKGRRRKDYTHGAFRSRKIDFS